MGKRLKAERRMEENNTVITEQPAGLKGISRCVGQESGISPPIGKANLFQSLGFTQHLGGLKCNIWTKY